MIVLVVKAKLVNLISKVYLLALRLILKTVKANSLKLILFVKRKLNERCFLGPDLPGVPDSDSESDTECPSQFLIPNHIPVDSSHLTTVSADIESTDDTDACVPTSATSNSSNP